MDKAIIASGVKVTGIAGNDVSYKWTTRPLEREYTTCEGDEIQLRVDGLAIWRGGQLVDFIKYKELEHG